jgi:hypothetical protein
VRDGEDRLFADKVLEVKGRLPAVQLQARAAIVNANRVKNPRDVVAIDFASASQVTLLGNVTSGTIVAPALATPAALGRLQRQTFLT